MKGINMFRGTVFKIRSFIFHPILYPYCRQYILSSYRRSPETANYYEEEKPGVYDWPVTSHQYSWFGQNNYPEWGRVFLYITITPTYYVDFFNIRLYAVESMSNVFSLNMKGTINLNNIRRGFKLDPVNSSIRFERPTQNNLTLINWNFDVLFCISL